MDKKDERRTQIQNLIREARIDESSKSKMSAVGRGSPRNTPFDSSSAVARPDRN